MTCENCHSKVEPEQNFCAYCGQARKGVSAPLQMAPFRLRAMAFAFDVWVALVLAASLASILPDSAVLLLLAVLPWLYFTVFQSAGRRTPGQALCGTAALHSDGRPLGIREAAERAVLQAFYWGLIFPPLLGPRCDWLTKRGQGEYLR